MKQKFTSMLLLVTILFVAIFSTAGAAGPVELKVNVRNATGAPVGLNLTDSDGNVTFYTLEPGVYPITLTEGVYSYYASLPCGNLAGSWNVNVVKTLFLTCKSDVAFASLSKTVAGCQFMGTWDSDFEDMMLGGEETEPDFYVGPGASERGVSELLCLDPYFSQFYSFDGWQIRYVDEFGDDEVIAEDPDFDFGG